MTIHTQTASTTESPNLRQEVLPLGYNDSTSTPHAVTACCPSQFVNIDLATGALTVLGSVADANVGLASGAAAMDSAGNRFFLRRRSPSRILTNDTETGSTTERPALGQELISLGYDSANGTLLGITACCPSQLVTIDLATGSLPALSTLGDANAYNARPAEVGETPFPHGLPLTRLIAG